MIRMRKLSITADDFGLTRSVTDAALKAFDRGVLTAVSILPNGDAVGYALAEYEKRRDRLTLSVHLNLTEGPALSLKEEVPLLTDERGMLCHSFVSLWAAYLFASAAKRDALRGQIRRELSAQIRRIREGVQEGSGLRLDGHQHIHMLPFVFDVVLSIAPTCGVSSVRIPQESFFLAPPWRVYVSSNLLKHILLNLLARHNRKKAEAQALAANSFFVGVLHSGCMSTRSLRGGLSRIARIAPSSAVEVLFHPGEERPDAALAQYTKSKRWYSSPWRARELDSLLSPKVKEIVKQFETERGGNPATWWDFWDQEHSIYVSDRHKDIHYDAIARDVLSLLPEKRPLTLLDYGCGDALSTDTFTRNGISVILHDPVPRVRDMVRGRFAGKKGVLIAEKLADAGKAIDVILVHSVLQYLSKDAFAALLPVFRNMLARGGMLVIGDVVPTRSHMIADVRSLLINAWRYGFLVAALYGLVVTFFSGYRALRKRAGFTTYTEGEMLKMLREASFEGKREPSNIGLTPHRMTFTAK